MKKQLIKPCMVTLIAIFVCLILIFLAKPKITYIDNVRVNIIQRSFVDKQIKTMSLKQKIASLFIFHTPGTDIATIKNYLDAYQPGGLIFMQDNIPESINELSEITNQIQTNKELPYLFAIDEEGGVVHRLPDDNFPAANDLKTQSIQSTESAFHERALLLKKAGMNLNFGIVADVTDNPESFIYPRVFGGNPTNVGDRVSAAVCGESGLVLSTLKHYPGHGEAEADSHFSIPITTISLDEWQKRDELPFKQGINAGAQFVMFGHLAYNQVDTKPASLSVKWHEILQNQDKFEGVSITDDMVMLQQSNDPNYSDPVKNAVGAINSGNTMLLYVLDHGGGATLIEPGTLIDGVMDAVNKGDIKMNIINNNVRKTMELRHNLSHIINKN